ncbi:MAG: amidase family protein [Rhodospirillaceae bacterium]|nr:amidase family protein [Rhodospirillaceae bacterium]
MAGRDRDRQARRWRPRGAWPVRPGKRAGRREAHTLIVLETAGWAVLDDQSKVAFEGLLENLQRAGVTLLRRADHPLVEKLEQAVVEAPAITGNITPWENRWAQRNLVNLKGEFVSERAKATLAKAEAMTPDDYRAAILAREAAQRAHAAIGNLADAMITLSCPGPAPLWPGDIQGQPLAPRPTGDAIFNTPSSMLFAPCVTMPLMSVGGMPVGAQVMGQQHQDARMTALARWIIDEIDPVVVD